jgi:hypothetical protein
VSIRIASPPEPLSPAVDENRGAAVLAESEAGRVFLQELRRYCDGEIRGRSILVAGHRGSGKTTMVEHGYQEVRREYVTLAAPPRPLLVVLQGPSLLSVRTAESPEPATPPTPPPATPAPGAEAAAHAAAAPPPPPADPPAQKKAAGDDELAQALVQATLGLHRAVAREFSEAYRRRIEDRRQTDPRRFAEAAELAAQLEVELYEGIDAVRLREFWARGGFLQTGVLFPPAPSSTRTPAGESRGFRELVALAGVCEAYRRISADVSRRDTSSDAAEKAASIGVDTGEKGAELFKPLAALLTGGLVGTGLLQTAAAPTTSVIGGIVAALGAVAVFRYSSTAKRTRKRSREANFVWDLSVQTLDRVLPILVDRLRACGLTPVFAIDELDKVTNLSEQIKKLVNHLKKFLSENAFFCFLADRAYYEAFQRRRRIHSYSAEYTYFGQQLFVTYGPRDLHDYLRTVLELEMETPAETDDGGPASPVPTSSEAAADHAILPYVLLHRAEMHTIDVQRLLVRWRGPDGRLTLSTGAVRTRAGYRIDLALQVAVEMVLESDDIAAMIEAEPAMRQVIHDALYFPSRTWRQGKPLDLREEGGEDGFASYLEDRIGKDEEVVADEPFVAPADRALLFARVREVGELLTDPQKYHARLSAWIADRSRAGRPVAQEIVSVLTATPPVLPLLRRRDDDGLCEWTWNARGVRVEIEALAGAVAAEAGPSWEEAAEVIERFAAALREVER